ncbi:substrate-binding periplasmic protein [Ramlibacter cellulosilyticus]|uniref:substrate-binding periplasmic protein n=1 Tax=Ramlibacter cellulosilyticus TaxID=2764187 RepID=UPI00338D83A1
MRRAFLKRGVAAALAFALPAVHAGGWQGIRQRGSLQVALYQEMPPFHAQGRGIDVDLARALAAQLGLGFSALPFAAGENMGDDLRNAVWKGHYLGWGPADVLLHVPVDAPLMRATPQVRIVAPYYRERVAVAFDRQRLPALESLAALRGQPIAVAGLSLAGWLMLGAEGGLLREQLQTHLPHGVAAAEALQRGEVAAAAGLASELESVLAGDARFALQPLPAPRAPRDGWAVGCAVRKDADELAAALQQGMQSLQASGELQAIFRAHRVEPRL